MSIFISHVEENRATADAIVRGLQSAGYQAWSYELSAVPGPTYLLQVMNAIEQASAVILIISPHALGSHQVAREIEAAHELDQPIIPVLQDITHEKYLQRRPEWRLALGAYTSIEVPREGVDAIMHKIVGGLQAFGVEPGEPSPSPPPPGYALPAPGYPGTAGGGGHKLGAGLIAAIIAAVVVIAGGVTATILLTDNSSHDAQQPVNPGVLIGPSSQTPSPTTTTTTTTTPSPTTTTTTTSPRGWGPPRKSWCLTDASPRLDDQPSGPGLCVSGQW